MKEPLFKDAKTAPHIHEYQKAVGLKTGRNFYMCRICGKIKS